MISPHSLVECIAVQEHDIVLEEVARAFFSKDACAPQKVDVLNQDCEYEPVGLRGLCKFYVPVNVGEESGDAKSFTERMRAVSSTSIGTVDSRCTRMKKGELSELLRGSEKHEKTELYNAFLQRYDKEYLVVIVGDISETYLT
ncbi:hypothetical protein HY483_03690 [Candidatus Woesearchaeota archaeon]|nr:hypothetical protein [Candidatus Woesearchaeota archaeon]